MDHCPPRTSSDWETPPGFSDNSKQQQSVDAVVETPVATAHPAAPPSLHSSDMELYGLSSHANAESLLSAQSGSSVHTIPTPFTVLVDINQTLSNLKDTVQEFTEENNRFHVQFLKDQKDSMATFFVDQKASMTTFFVDQKKNMDDFFVEQRQFLKELSGLLTPKKDSM